MSRQSHASLKGKADIRKHYCQKLQTATGLCSLWCAHGCMHNNNVSFRTILQIRCQLSLKVNMLVCSRLIKPLVCGPWVSSRGHEVWRTLCGRSASAFCTYRALRTMLTFWHHDAYAARSLLQCSSGTNLPASCLGTHIGGGLHAVCEEKSPSSGALSIFKIR